MSRFLYQTNVQGLNEARTAKSVIMELGQKHVLAIQESHDKISVELKCCGATLEQVIGPYQGRNALKSAYGPLLQELVDAKHLTYTSERFVADCPSYKQLNCAVCRGVKSPLGGHLATPMGDEPFSLATYKQMLKLLIVHSKIVMGEETLTCYFQKCCGPITRVTTHIKKKLNLLVHENLVASNHCVQIGSQSYYLTTAGSLERCPGCDMDLGLTPTLQKVNSCTQTLKSLTVQESHSPCHNSAVLPQAVENSGTDQPTEKED